jgi:Rrf2 family protein
MKLTRTTGYAMVAVAYIAKDSDQTPTPAKEIAKHYKIPLEYLLKIMQQLVRNGILTSNRGPRGGFMLAKTADKISLSQIVEAIEGPAVVSPSILPSKTSPNTANQLCRFYRHAIDESTKILSKAKLSDILPSGKQAPKTSKKK